MSGQIRGDLEIWMITRSSIYQNGELENACWAWTSEERARTLYEELVEQACQDSPTLLLVTIRCWRTSLDGFMQEGSSVTEASFRFNEKGNAEPALGRTFDDKED